MRSSERGAASPPTSRGGDGQAVRLAFTSRGRARESPGKQNRDEETNLSNERKTEFRDRPFHPERGDAWCEPVMGNKQSRVMGYTFQYGWFGLFGKGIMVPGGGGGRRGAAAPRSQGLGLR